MFDFTMILEMFKAGDHNFVQIALLFMIWMSSLGIKREVKDMRIRHGEAETQTKAKFQEHDDRFVKVEGRVTVLENQKELK